MRAGGRGCSTSGFLSSREGLGRSKSCFEGSIKTRAFLFAPVVNVTASKVSVLASWPYSRFAPVALSPSESSRPSPSKVL